MTPDWLLIGVIAIIILAMVISFVMGACVAAGHADDQAEQLRRDIERENDRVIRHGQEHPWSLPR